MLLRLLALAVGVAAYSPGQMVAGLRSATMPAARPAVASMVAEAPPKVDADEAAKRADELRDEQTLAAAAVARISPVVPAEKCSRSWSGRSSRRTSPASTGT